ncbi:hypothetical protein ACFLZL_01150 [Thermodesulfobacteriota bacterium]
MFLSALLFVQPINAIEYQQVKGLVDTRTIFSDGALDVEGLARLAADKGFDALFYNDHDRMVMEYGLPPFRNLIKKRVELNSINKNGAEQYLSTIQKTDRKFKDLILIPGSESAPFYYWSGSYFSKDLTAHDHEKRILTIGMEKPRDYEQLPILHNGHSTRHIRRYIPMLFFFIMALLLGLLLLREKGFFKISGMIISLFAFLLIADNHPFKNSPFDQYSGNQGIKPYQLLIDYVNSKGGLTFWNYPETKSGIRKLGPVFVNTPPYPEALIEAQNYTGFAAIYGQNITVTEPGHQWDRILSAYCLGERKQPVWGIATADYHKEGESGGRLGDFPTVILVQRKTQKEILFAMQKGRMYGCQTTYPQQIILNDFSICSPKCKTRAILGEEIRLKGNPNIHISLALKIPNKKQAEVRLIRSGRLVRTFKGTLPMDIDYEDHFYKPGEKIFYRMDVKGPGILVSNPIFVRFD